MDDVYEKCADKRDFIYRYETQYNTPAYYIVSKCKPMDKKNLWQIQSFWLWFIAYSTDIN